MNKSTKISNIYILNHLEYWLYNLAQTLQHSPPLSILEYVLKGKLENKFMKRISSSVMFKRIILGWIIHPTDDLFYVEFYKIEIIDELQKAHI